MCRYVRGEPILIADSDAVLSDPDSSTLESLTATITNPIDGPSERLSADTSGTLISASYSPASDILTLSGTYTLATFVVLVYCWTPPKPP